MTQSNNSNSKEENSYHKKLFLLVVSFMIVFISIVAYSCVTKMEHYWFVNQVEKLVNASDQNSLNTNLIKLNNIQKNSEQSSDISLFIDENKNNVALTLVSSKKQCESLFTHYLLSYYYVQEKRRMTKANNMVSEFSINEHIVPSSMVINENILDAFCQKGDNTIMFNYKLKNF